MSKTIRRILSGMMLLMLMLTSSFSSLTSVYAATLKDQLPIIAYTLNGRVDTYNDIDSSKTVLYNRSCSFW